MESCIAAFRMRDSILNWDSLTSDLVLEWNRISSNTYMKQDKNSIGADNEQHRANRATISNNKSSKKSEFNFSFCGRKWRSANECFDNPDSPRFGLTRQAR